LAELPVTVRFWDGSELRAAAGGPSAGVLHVRREAIGYLVRTPNQLGLARAYVAGTLDLDGDLEPLLDLRRELERAPGMTVRQRLTAAAQAVIATGPRALRTAVPAAEFRQRGHLHSIARDRRAVRHHYDVSNAFYRMLLGPSLVYSCAYFETPDDDLEIAQERKLELICRKKLQLSAGERFLDIGCGWGSLVNALRTGFASHLAPLIGFGLRAADSSRSSPQAVPAGR